MFAVGIGRKRVDRMKSCRQWRWHLDEVFVKINGEMHYLWRAVDHEGEVLESFVTKTRDRTAALKFLKKSMKRHGRPETIVTDRLRSYGAALKGLGRGDDRENVAFGLTIAGDSKAVKDARVAEAARILQMEHLLERRARPGIWSSG